MITWSRNQSVKWLDGWWPFTINLHHDRCGSHRPRRSGDISFFISHVTSCGHVIIGWSLPSVVTIRLVKVQIWSILISNVRIGIHMIILLQSVTIQFRRLFWHISYYKVRQSNFITKCDRLLLQVRQVLKSVTDCYYKVDQVLQTVTDFITKRVRHYKLRQLL